MQLYIVDVFAERRYAGNQLAVIRGAAGLSTEEMQEIALEMYFSETTFILSDDQRDGGYDVRIFTTDTEMPFAGHPTLGTAAVIASEIHPASQVTLNLQVGQIPVTLADDNVWWMRQNPPVFGYSFDHAAIAHAIGLSLADMNTRFPVQVVSTGVPFVIAPLQSLDAVKRLKVDWEAFQQVTGKIGGLDGLLVFAPETYHAQNDLNVRVVFPIDNLAEDPATGSANGPLAAYLSKYRYFGDAQVDCRVEQGYEIRRPSLLLLRAEGERVEVGGQVFMVARGELIRDGD